MKTLRSAAFCMLLAAPLAALAEAGRVLVAVGEVIAERGAERIALARGAALEAGDTIRTGPASNVQIRMTDGAIVSLRERTVLRIDEHVWSGRVDGTERSFLSLLAGGIRTVTGAIGNLRREDRYGVRTPTASIGIRGTHFTLRECNELSPCALRGERVELELAQASEPASDAPGVLAQAVPAGEFAPRGTYGGVSDGRIGVKNDAGEAEFAAREFFYVADRATPPQGLVAPPPFLYDRLPGRTRTAGQAGAETGETIAQGGIQAESRPSGVPPAPRPSEFAVTEQRAASGEPAVLPVSAVPTVAAVGAFFDFPGPGDGGAFLTPAEVTLSGSGALLGFSARAGFLAQAGGGSAAVSGSAPATAVVDETVSNALGASWGRWLGGSFTGFSPSSPTTNFSPANPFHYLLGPLTPPEVIAAKTGTFMMSVVGGTTPTNDLGETGTFSMFTTSVDFTAKNFASAGFSFTFPSQSWSFASVSTPIQISAGKGAFVHAVTSGSCYGCVASPIPAILRMTGIFMGSQGDHLGVGFSASAGTSHASTAKILTCSPSC